MSFAKLPFSDIDNCYKRARILGLTIEEGSISVDGHKDGIFLNAPLQIEKGRILSSYVLPHIITVAEGTCVAVSLNSEVANKCQYYCLPTILSAGSHCIVLSLKANETINLVDEQLIKLHIIKVSA
jgi:hypothetical protein